MGTIEVISKNADLSGLLESGEPIAVFDKFFGNRYFEWLRVFMRELNV